MPDQPPANDPPTPEEAEPEGLFEEATREADRYKWLESEKAGRDLGQCAIRDWHANYWRSWCRERWIEHLHGDRFWVELDKDDHGLLRRKFSDNLELTESIIERILHGGENLDIIQWATEEGYDLDTVIGVLKALDINSRRLAPPEDFEADPPPPDEEPTASRTRRVLVIDDDHDTCELIGELLVGEGLEVTVAHSGEDAITEIEKRRYHCYLVDIMLPGRHGAEVAWYLRRHGVTAPVIAISAVLDRWNEDDLYDCGFTGVMGKPFDINALRELAREVVSKTPPAVGR